jgi:pimeloyl-ACP methyl ester carboxylesterase
MQDAIGARSAAPAQLTPRETFARYQAEVLAERGVRATSRMLAESSEHPIHVLEAGRGEPLLLVHGGGSNAAGWASLVRRLQHDFRCIAVDRPGHGLSYRIDYRRVPDFRADAVAFVRRTLDQLELERATLVGGSMGGFFSLAFALEHPERVDRLVLVGAPAGIDRFIPPPLRALSVPLLGPLLWKTLARPTEEGMRRFHQKLLVADASNLTDAELRCGVASHSIEGASRGWLTVLRRFVGLGGVRDSCYIRDELCDLTVPTLFAWGDRDAFAPPSSGEQACRTMVDARIEIIEAAGHLPWVDSPDRCASAIREFLARPPSHQPSG